MTYTPEPYEPERGLREALTKIDVGEAEVVITPAIEAAEWAADHGYRVEVAEMDDTPVYEIHPGDSGV